MAIQNSKNRIAKSSTFNVLNIDFNDLDFVLKKKFVWNDEKKEIVKKYYKKVPNEILALKLNISISYLRQQIRKMKYLGELDYK